MTRHVYCIDSSAIFDAWEDQPRDIFASLWDQLDELTSSGQLIAPEEVRVEIRRPPALKQWGKERDGLFRELGDDHEQRIVTEVVDRLRAELRARNLRLRPADFKADPFVVALARLNDATVVAHEKHQQEEMGRPKIPNMCAWYGLRSIRFLDFVRELGLTF